VNDISTIDFLGVLPETILVLTALIVTIVDAAKTSAKSAVIAPVLSALGLVASGAAVVLTWGDGGTIFSGAVFHDGFSSLFRVLFTVIGLLTIAFAPHYLQKTKMRLGEIYALILTATFGMMVMVSAASLLLFFLGLETMSISLYILAGLQRSDAKSAEASMKYLIMGGFSSAFLLYGIALMYTVAGSVDYSAITAFFAAGQGQPNALLISSVALLMLGFAFKVAAVPFHFWSPDVYDGAPTVVTAFMSTGPKAAAFVALIRVFGIMLGPLSSMWVMALSVMAVLTMTVGNLTALRQTSVKRMLAYSAIAHAGYLLVGIVAGTKAAFAATGYYLAAYALTNLGAFACIILINRKRDGSYHSDQFRGVGFSHPVLGAVFTVFLLSLTGMPPTAGFFGKLYVFSSAIQQGHILLAIIALLNSAVGAYYYLRIITLMYMSKADEPQELAEPLTYRIALVLSSILIVVIGMFPEQLLQVITISVP
jgi:NADH-quinone oxidoreductase subunit N